MTDASPHPLEWMTAETELNMPLAQIGKEVYRLAMKIEDGGNRGFSRQHFINHNEIFTKEPLCVDLLKNKYLLAWENILFHAEGSRRSDFNGWGVRRKPPWWMIWMSRYEALCPEIVDQMISEAWDAARIEHEQRKVRRKVTRVIGMDLEELDTQTVAYYAALFDVMSRRAGHRYISGRRTDTTQMMLARMYRNTSDEFNGELVYRTKGEPQERSSKKKTLAARLDWEKASHYREEGNGAFFTADFVTQCVESDVEPDLTVDFENLPKRTLAETPIVKLPDRDLIAEFMKLLTGEDEFEREDAQLILRALRPMLARARGQHGTVETTISQDDEVEA